MTRCCTGEGAAHVMSENTVTATAEVHLMFYGHYVNQRCADQAVLIAEHTVAPIASDNYRYISIDTGVVPIIEPSTRHRSGLFGSTT